MDLDGLSHDPLKRLAQYRRARIADEEERLRVEAILRKPPEERTELDERWVAYSRYGTASSHGY